MDRRRLLQLECDLVTQYLAVFSPSPSGRPRAVWYREFGSGANRDTLMIVEHFPLPDVFRPVDEMDLLLNLSRFPEDPPIGIYVMESPAMMPVITKLKKTFNVFGDGRAFHNAVPPVDDYSWVCHVYDNNQWRRNNQAPQKGDCIYKFLQSFFAASERA
jgi:hypothetical protein